MRQWMRPAVALFTALFVCALPVLADQLIGTVQEVDVAAKKIVVKPKGKGKDNVTVTVTDSTTYETAKGKAINKAPLEKLKKGTILEIEHTDAKASKIVVKGNPNAKKKADSPKKDN
ncbi:MAG: hypothetical protein ACKO0V_03690 [bacterium]